MTSGIAERPAVVTVNVEVESHDERIAGGAGLFGRYSYGRYGAREGVWRLLDAFADEGVKATFFIDGDDAGRHPAIVEAVLSGGHEVAQLGPPDIEAESDRGKLHARLTQTRDALAAVAGRPVVGWRAAAGVLTPETLPLLAELGFRYDSSFQDDDWPYVFGDGATGASLVELPVFRYLTDSIFYAARRTDDTVRKAWAEELAAMYAEGSYLALTVNSRGDVGSGRELRTRVVADWIRAAKRMPGVVFQRCDVLAQSWADRRKETEPFPFLEEFEAGLMPQ